MSQDPLIKNLQLIIEKKNIFLVVVVLLVFLIAAVILFGDYSSKMMNYQQQLKIKKEKIDVIGEYKESKEVYAKFLSSLPEAITSDILYNQVTDYAARNNIDIIDVANKDAQKHDYYTSLNLHLNVKVKDFRDLVSFFQMVETSPYLLKVDYFSGVVNNAQVGSFNCEINIIATQIDI